MTYPVSVIVVGVSGTVNPLLGKKGLALKICIRCVCLCLCLCVRERPNGVMNWVTFNYACVYVYTCLRHSALFSQRQRERERERDVMNWVTFNYACDYIYTCICDAQHSSVTVHWKKVSRKLKILEQNVGVTVVFIYARCFVSSC